MLLMERRTLPVRCRTVQGGAGGEELTDAVRPARGPGPAEHVETPPRRRQPVARPRGGRLPEHERPGPAPAAQLPPGPGPPHERGQTEGEGGEGGAGAPSGPGAKAWQ